MSSLDEHSNGVTPIRRHTAEHEPVRPESAGALFERNKYWLLLLAAVLSGNWKSVAEAAGLSIGAPPADERASEQAAINAALLKAQVEQHERIVTVTIPAVEKHLGAIDASIAAINAKMERRR